MVIASLALLLAIAPPPRTTSMLVIQSGRTVYEWGANKPHYTASLAKALVGGMSLLVALNDGRMKPDDPAWKYIPAWRDDPLKRKITIRHLATHSSGIQDAETDGVPHDKLTGWMGAFWKRQPDPFSIAVHDAPVIFEPGSRYHYSNPGMAALAYAMTRALGKDLRTVLQSRIMRQLGIPDEEWSVGYNRTYEVDGLQLVANWGGGSYTPRAVARVAALMLHDGEGRFQREWARRMVVPAGTPAPDRTKEPGPLSGLCWYSNADGVWPAVPRDAFAGGGAGHQLLLVVPSLDLIVVRMGDAMGPEPFWLAAYNHLFEPVMRAVTPPRSPVISGVTFAPADRVRRSAAGSDNWPITWLDDGDQFTAYGDGWGFEPRTEKKLSMGFARITGDAESFAAKNVRSETGERAGDGKTGLKASGIVMAGGVLYMWVRNAGNSQLAWSEDRGRTWQWGFKFDESFGSPAFLNAGRNYTAARDGYVYAFSQDGPSAYEQYDAIVLARAPVGRIRDRAAWEFFVRRNDDGRAVWSRNIADRGPVLWLAGRCERVDVVWNPGLKRYMMALGCNHTSGWGLFDAPAPWGPWTTAFHTEQWDIPGTHGYRLPAKWISPDGRSMRLIFSGVKDYDAFCVRRMDVQLRH